MRHKTELASRLLVRIAIAAITGLLTAATVRAEHGASVRLDNHALRGAFESIQARDLRKHATYLADDTFEGREAGRRGGRAAGVYLGQELRRHKLAGGGSGGGYYQPFGDRHRNVLALLEGSDPRLKEEVVVVSAHYDHVGYGNEKNSLGPIGYIHNGADDNASGTAALLEVIEAFRQHDLRPKRTILFAFWDAEEKGLLGSKHWVAKPTLPLRRVRALVNMDMVGRLRQGKLEVYGIRTAPGLRELVTRNNSDLGLRLDFSWEIKNNSDHHPFFEREVPYVMLHTGLHKDYHTPRDDADKLNVDGMQSVSRFCFLLVHDLADRPSIPRFRADSKRETVSRQRAFERPARPQPTRLGISWDHQRRTDAMGIRIIAVDRGSAADRGGLRAGDRLLRFDDREIRDDAEFQAWVLAAEKRVLFSLQRAGEEKPRDVPVDLDGGPVRIGIAWRTDDAEPGCVAVSRVVPASPADRAGLKVNDRIYRVAGNVFYSSDELYRQLTKLPSPIELQIGREGNLRTMEIELAK